MYVVFEMCYNIIDDDMKKIFFFNINIFIK